MSANYYNENAHRVTRIKTDAEFPYTFNDIKLCGEIDKNISFILEKQLFDEEYWTLFAMQFATGRDDADRGWRGEYFGKMMRGASMVYQYTKNEKLYNILTDCAKLMLTRQDELGRFSTYTVEKEFCGWDMWCRKYVLLGFIHYLEICRDESLKEQIVKALERHLDYILEKIGEGKIDIETTSHFWLGINSASILEPVVLMYNITKKESYLKFARYIISRLEEGKANIVTLAYENKIPPYKYPTTKAYEMMSCFEGLLEYYRITGEEKWLVTVSNFVKAVEETDITLIGCAGCEHELFNHSKATQTDTDYKGIMQETCVSVTWMKLNLQLLTLTGDAHYADNIELTLYNALNGAINTEFCDRQGNVFAFDSYSPLTEGNRGRGIGGHKNLTDDKYYGCCVAIGAAGLALPAISSVVKIKDGLAINFYETLSAKFDVAELSVKTDYPTSESVLITLDKVTPEFKALKLRAPEYSKSVKALVSGEDAENTLENGYITITREWKDGDRVELLIDMTPRALHAPGVDEKPETKNFFALMYGPLVLAKEANGTIPFAEDFTIEKTGSESGKLMSFKVSVGDNTFEMSNYSDTGKDWKGAPIEAWIKTE